jgi:uncharacterized protein (DUF2062 family)
MRLSDRRRPAWVARLRAWLPRPHRLRESRAVAWLGPALHHPRVWHFTRRGVALGVAVGVFFGLLVPVGQIAFAAAAAVVLRANLPVAAISTLVTNPFTFVPIYFAAYRLGHWLLGGDPVLTEEGLARTIEVDTWWLRVWVDRMVNVGRPLVLGLCVFAVGLSAAGYLVVDQLWRLLAWRAWRRRRDPVPRE